MKDFTLIIGPRYFEILRGYTLDKQKRGRPSLGELPSWIYISKDIKQKLKLWVGYVRQKTHMEVHITWTGPEQYEVGFHNRWPNKTKIKIKINKKEKDESFHTKTLRRHFICRIFIKSGEKICIKNT